MKAFLYGMLIALCGLASQRSAAQSTEVVERGAAAALAKFYAIDPRHEGLAERASGMLIFPVVVKGGVALANEYGRGVLKIGGSTAGYYSLTSASVGLTAGMASRSEIVLFMTREALDRFLHSRKWSLGVDTAIAVTSKGAAVAFDARTLHKPVLVFEFNEAGLMADVSLQGTKISKLPQ